MNRNPSFAIILTLVCLVLYGASFRALAQEEPAVARTQISSDPFTVGPGQHATEVEPHMLANGITLVAAFQTGRIAPGGATAIGWATSTDGGVTWAQGFLPGLTTGNGGGPYSAASDPAVAYDAKHGVWMIASLPVANSGETPAVVVNRSTDGGLTWNDPVNVTPNVASSDKNWIVCDSYSSSPFYGNCYVEWDNPAAGDRILMSTSSDGGVTWGPATATANNATGIGGQPLVQPNGTVVVPFEGRAMQAFSSTNGGTSWSAPATIAKIQAHLDAGGIRSGPLPSAAVDGAGNVWVVWEDCRFRSSCSTNDLVYSTSSDGTHWSAVTRVPIDATTSVVDHFIPGIGIDPATSGSSAHVAHHLLLLHQHQMHAVHLQTQRGLHFVTQWRNDVERRADAFRPDAAQVAAQLTKRPDGWRLHRDRLYQRRAARRIRGSHGAVGKHLQRIDVHRAGPDSRGEWSSVLIRRRQAAYIACPMQLRGSSRKKA